AAATGLDLCGLGYVREQPQSQVLCDYQERAEATGARDGGLGTDLRCHRARASFGRPEMTTLRQLLAKARGLFGYREPDFDSEIADHLTLLTERYVRQGMTPAEAQQAARRQFGNTTLLQEHRRELQTVAAIDAFARDLRY